MRRRGTVIGALASFGVLAVGWGVGAADATTTTSPGSSSGSSSSATGGSSTGSTGTSLQNGTFTGDVESTRFGDVQVSVTIAGGEITDITALHLTDREQRSVAISNEAAPLLKAEVLQAQSANVSTISGATYTSDGYLTSLQSALDKAAP